MKTLRAGLGLVLIATSTLVFRTGGKALSLNAAGGTGSNVATTFGRLDGSSQEINSGKEANGSQEQNSKDEIGCEDQNYKRGERSPRLHAQAPGVSLSSPRTLLSAVTIVNRGKEPAEDVEVNFLDLPGGKLTVPLPVKLGTIKPDGGALVDADFEGSSFKHREIHRLFLR